MISNYVNRRLLCLLPMSFLMASTGLLTLGCAKKEKVAQDQTAWRDGGIKDSVNAYSQISKLGKGIAVGNQSAERKAYVIFDPRCQHCAHLWSASMPVAMDGSVKFVWIPVGLVSKESLVLSAAIYESTNPLAAMAANEKSISEKTGGMKLTSLPSEAAMEVITRNGKLAEMVGLQEVPITMMKDANGTPIIAAGAMSTERLREFLAR